METTSIDQEKDSYSGYGVIYDLGYQPYFVYEAFKKLQESGKSYYKVSTERYRSASFFGNTSYEYKRRYGVNGTLRYDKTNNFAGSPHISWIPTWNVGLWWNTSREKFFPKSKIVSSLSFRGSYGMTGKEPSITNSIEEIGSEIPWRRSETSKELALIIKSMANHNLTYEKNYELNLGTSIGFLKNRINLGIGWYDRQNKDLIGGIPTQGVGGVILKYGNVAEMKSSGLELSLQTRNLKSKTLNWTTTFAYSKSKTEITKLYSNETSLVQVQGTGYGREGYPSGALFSYPFRGLTNEGYPQFLDQNGNVAVGTITYSERNKVGYLSYSGTRIPTDVGSINNVLKYKGFSLGAFVTYSFGNVVRLRPFFTSTYSELSNLGREMNDRWIKQGDEYITNVPVIPNNNEIRTKSTQLANAYYVYNYSDIRIAKGDFIRLKEVSIGYDFDKDVLEKLKIRRLGLKLQADNLFLLYADRKLNGDDPEYLQSGNMVTRRFVLSLRVGL